MVGALALAEALAAAVAVRGGSKVLARLRSVQQRLDAQGAYWEKVRENASAAAASRRQSPGRTSQEVR
jgi:hypothetical protein